MLKIYFELFYPETKVQLTRNFIGSIKVTYRSKVAKIILIGNSGWPPSWKSIALLLYILLPVVSFDIFEISWLFSVSWNLVLLVLGSWFSWKSNSVGGWYWFCHGIENMLSLTKLQSQKEILTPFMARILIKAKKKVPCLPRWLSWMHVQLKIRRSHVQSFFWEIDYEIFSMIILPFRWFKKDWCQFLVKEYAQVLVNGLDN